jgi:glycosyltransferase involved in cell wall biosynthesis
MAEPIRVGFVLHVMQVAGAEVLVDETIRRLGSRISPVVFCIDKVGTLGERLLSDGVPVIAYGRKPGLDFSVSRRMAADIRTHRIQVIHAHQYTPFFYSAIAARLSGIRPRVIFTEHGRHYPDVVSARRRWINRLILDRLADDVNAVCEFSAHSLAEKDGFRANRIEVIPNGIDAPKYEAVADRSALKARLGLDPQRRYVICVARFHPVKDHRTLIAAFAQVAAEVGDVDLLLVGDGELRPAIESQIRELGLDARVKLLGVRRDVADLLRASDIFALTSVSEAASITLLEAMGAGLPVVVTAVGGNPELVRDGADGILAPRGDASAIATALSRILGDDSLARTFGASGAARVRDRYLLDDTLAHYYKLYAFEARLNSGAMEAV